MAWETALENEIKCDISFDLIFTITRMLTMRKNLLVLFLSAASTVATAQNPKAPPAQEITRQIVKTMMSYASAISCPGVKINPKFIAPLIPWKFTNDRFDSRYAVLWYGDIGCSGGNSSVTTNISIVTVGAGNTVLVNPMLSSPGVEFESPVTFVEKVVSNTEDSLLLEGMELGPNDPSCCPSLLVRFTMRTDQKGNWKTTEKKIISTKK